MVKEQGIDREGDKSEDDNIFDVVIIGGGPAGLSAAMYAARSGLTSVVLDKSPSAGALGTTDKIENYPGQIGPMKGKDLLKIFSDQAKGFGAKIVQAQVFMVDLESEPKEIYTADGKYKGRTVLIASGAMGRKPTIHGEVEFTGKGVSYCATCDAAFFKDKDIAAVGDLDKILEEVDVLARFARKVHIITKTKEATKEQMDQISSEANLELHLGLRVLEIIGGPPIKSVKTRSLDGEESMIDVSGVFIFLSGNKPVVDFLHDALDRSPDGSIVVEKDDMSTSIPGVFAIGDVASKRYRQVVVATADGCIAALSADKYINKRKKTKYLWSKK